VELARGDLVALDGACRSTSINGAGRARDGLSMMAGKPLDLPNGSCQEFVRDMRAYFAEPNAGALPDHAYADVAVLWQSVNIAGLEAEFRERFLLLLRQLRVQQFRSPPFRDGGQHQCQCLAWLG
jgi:hypothetical protein